MALQLIKKIFGFKGYKIQTFTYYIPSPPARSTSYREKQFDKVFYQFINQGYEIISVNTQGNTSDTHSGMWVIFTVRATNKYASELDLESFSPLEIYDDPNNCPESIDGYYPIND